MARILIKGGRVFDGKDLVCKDVFTENGKITKIEPRIDEECDFVFDAKEKLVLPGLVDSHVHIKGLSSPKYGFPAELLSIPFGVTAVCDAGSGLGDKTLLDSMAVKSVVYISYSKDEKANDILLEKYGDRAIGVKIYFDSSISPDITLDNLKECCKYARSRNLKVMVHSSNSPASMTEIVKALSAGDILTHAYHGGKNTCEENGFEALRLAKEKGVIIDSGFAGYVHTDFGIFRRAVKSGFIPDVISTDITKASAYTRGGKYGMPMCMSIAREAGMAEADIFKAVNENPAKALGKEDSWGSLAVGRAADIAVLDYSDEEISLTDKSGNSIESKKGYRCLLTVSDGQILYKY